LLSGQQAELDTSFITIKCSFADRNMNYIVPGCTVKASNFGPHGNFGPFISEGLAVIKTRPTEK
jgi:hypothetical protein